MLLVIDVLKGFSCRPGITANRRLELQLMELVSVKPHDVLPPLMCLDEALDNEELDEVFERRSVPSSADGKVQTS